MSTVLYIKSNPKESTVSNTYKMSEAFLEEYKKNNPDDTIVELDLYNEDIKFLDGALITQMYSEDMVNSVMYKYAKQFVEADKYVFAAPMWNLSTPAILKAYFDYISLPGVTFAYTPEGPVGLLKDKNKKVAFISSRGGQYAEGPGADFEMGERYFRTILGFYGVYDIETITLELASVLQGDDLENALEKSIAKAKEVASRF